MHKTTAYYIKTIIIVTLLLVLSATLTNTLLVYVQTADYFSTDLNFYIRVAVLMLVLLYVYALSIGAWDKWEQYVIVPLPISLGIIIALIDQNPVYAFLAAGVALALLIYDVYNATYIMHNLVRYSTNLVLRFSTKSLLFMFALLAAFLVLISGELKNAQEFNLAQKVTNLAKNQINTLISSQGTDAGFQQSILNSFGTNLPNESETNSLFGQNILNIVVGSLNDEAVGEIVETQVENFIEPYRQFVPSLLALLVFGLIQFIAFVVLTVFKITSWPLMLIAKGTHFIHSNNRVIEQEVLSFSKETKLSSITKQNSKLKKQQEVASNAGIKAVTEENDIKKSTQITSLTGLNKNLVNETPEKTSNESKEQEKNKNEKSQTIFSLI